VADFCRQCSAVDFPDINYDEHGDLVGLCAPGETIDVICEGCGWTVPVDHRGECQVHDECLGVQYMDECLDEMKAWIIQEK
jgi:hypothetical protein